MAAACLMLQLLRGEFRVLRLFHRRPNKPAFYSDSAPEPLLLS